jgi:hypothetical protein
MIKMNVNAMTNGEIVAQYHGLVQQVATLEKVGHAIIGDAIKEKMAVLKAAMDEKGLIA